MLIKNSPSYFKNRSFHAINRLLKTSSSTQKFLLISGFLLFGAMFTWSSLIMLFGRSMAGKEWIYNNNREVHHYNSRISRPEKIEIGISEKDFQKIQKERAEALEAGILVSSEDSYVPARIRHNQQVYRAKIRLKGDWAEHLAPERKWSYRISMEYGDTLWGMKEFSIQHPQQRNFIFGWLFQQLARMEGIISLRVKFIEVTLNGEPLGIYYLEEHFDKLLVEHNQYREGPIIKFNEDLIWADRKEGRHTDAQPSAFYDSVIDVFQPNKIFKDPVLRRQFLTAYNLLERFRSRELAPDQVFDIEKMAKYYALCDVLGASHATIFHNMRFYYNPITSRLEPIAFDADAGQVIQDIQAARKYADTPFYDFDRILFSSDVFMSRYLGEMERMADPAFFNEKIAGLNDDLQKQKNILYKEFPDYTLFLKGLNNNRKLIMYRLYPIKAVHAYLKEIQGNAITLRLGNIYSLPIEIIGVAYQGRVFYRPKAPIVLKEKEPGALVNYVEKDFHSVVDLALTEDQQKELKIIYRTAGTQKYNAAEVFPISFYEPGFPEGDVFRQKSSIDKFPLIIRNEQAKVIMVKPGRWKIKEDLIVPEGYIFVMRGGTTLDLSASAKIVSFSPVSLIGSEHDPIRIESEDSTGQGLAVIDAKGRSDLQYVVFENLAAPSQKGWELTGAVTFYQSPVDILFCQFSGNRASDDSLNIVRSEFTLRQSRFFKSFADAVDVDFSNGKIEDVQFEQNGNDALDASGSKLEISRVFVKGAGDKGISAGELSEVRINTIQIVDARIGIASKDISMVNVDGAKIANCEIGFAAFQKKPEYGPANMKIFNLLYENIKTPFAQQPGSSIGILKENMKLEEWVDLMEE